MIVKALPFNEKWDIQDVDQFGFINLAECMENGVVPSSVSDTELNYNDIEDPASIMGKPRDVFEAYSMQDYIKSAGKKSEGAATVEQS